jgi:hypothetical protein
VQSKPPLKLLVNVAQGNSFYTHFDDLSAMWPVPCLNSRQACAALNSAIVLDCKPKMLLSTHRITAC